MNENHKGLYPPFIPTSSVFGACEDAALPEPPTFSAGCHEVLTAKISVHCRTDLQAV